MIKKLLFVYSLVFVSCTKFNTSRKGWMNKEATNFNAFAEENDDSCVFPELREDLIGDYFVNRTEIHFVGDIDTTYFLDTITIAKGGNYNHLKISGYDYLIEFNTGKLSFYSCNQKHPPIANGTLIQNQLQLSTTFHMIHGGKIHMTLKSGSKIN